MFQDLSRIQLTPDQQAELANVSAATGKPWPVVLHEALTAYRTEGAAKESNPVENFLEAASRLGFIGCLEGGPPDLSNNPAYMEGFGRSDG